mmetsp:Transcript_29866/g.99023  ORF Transcript_29866/g.99023 Transcript_29866/m.99023 type:complete len:163 (-) Transcript_29866:180-668(-)
MQFNAREGQLVVLGEQHDPNTMRFDQTELRAVLYNLTTQGWATTGELLTCRSNQAVCVAPTGSIVCTGGFTCGSHELEQSCEELVVEGSHSMSLPAAIVGRFGHSLLPVYGRHLLHLGGSTTPAKSTEGLLASVELYDSVAKEWISLPSLPCPLLHPGVCGA